MNYPKKATLLSTRSSNMTQTLVAAREVKKESHLKAGCQPRQQTCVSSEVNTLNMHEHGNTPGSTSSQWKQRKHRKPNKLQCMMHSHNRHSRTLSFDLFTFINSPRPPLAALYTTRINNSTRAWQQFGEEGCQCVCVWGGVIILRFKMLCLLMIRRKHFHQVQQCWHESQDKHTDEPSVSVTVNRQ